MTETGLGSCRAEGGVSRILNRMLQQIFAPLWEEGNVNTGGQMFRKRVGTHAESPDMMMFSLSPAIPMIFPFDSTKSLYISNASSIANGYGSNNQSQSHSHNCKLETHILAPCDNLPIILAVLS